MPLYRLPVAAELLCGCFEVTVPKFAILAASNEVTNHRSFFQIGEILALWPLECTPSSGHASTEDGKAFDRRFKVRVVISSYFYWGGRTFFDGRGERHRFCRIS